ncbi:MAG TPA: hypothetical protein VN428_08060 [Bryobacteraceae bacterium]|nr:hypothetical protein [Bryobacteraceae bacterium]
MLRAAVFMIASAWAFAAPAPTLLRHTVPAAAVVAGVRVTDVRDTAFGRFLLKEFAGEGPEFENFVKATGFDPRRDIQELLYSAPVGDGWLIAARGTFPADRLIMLGKLAGAEITPVQGIQMVNTAKAAASPLGKPMAFAFLDANTAVAGDERSVRQAITRRRIAGGPAPQMATRATQLAGVWPAWFVANDFSMISGSTPLSSGMQKMVQRASGGFRFGDTVGLNAELIARTVNDAKTLAEFLRFLSKAGEGATDPQAAAIAQMLSTAEVSVAATSVKIGLTIPESVLEAFVTESRLEEPAGP